MTGLRRFLRFHRINCAPEYIDICTSGNGEVRTSGTEKAPKKRRVHRLYFSFLSICSNFAIKSPSSSEIVFSWLAVAPSMTCSSSWLAFVVVAETVPNVLHFSVVGITSSFSFGFIPTIAAILSVNDVLLFENRFLSFPACCLLDRPQCQLVRTLSFSFLVLLHLEWVLIPWFSFPPPSTL